MIRERAPDIACLVKSLPDHAASHLRILEFSYQSDSCDIQHEVKVKFSRYRPVQALGDPEG
jgi:hypothetical protein